MLSNKVLGWPHRKARLLTQGQEPALGAHVVTPRFGFSHHGIYVGDGNVVHYGALIYDVIRKPVEEVSLECFAQQRPVFVVDHDETTLSEEEVIRRARSRLGEGSYRLLTNNCEHFCEWVLHGEARSFQVELALAFPRLVGERIQGYLLRAVQRWVAPRRLQIARPAPRREVHAREG
jgi:Lecithin retinol acyltransferase